MSALRIATIDIETSPAVAYTFGTKNVFIANSQVIEPTRTLCVGVKWLGEAGVEMHSEWDEGGHDEMILALWHTLDQADAVVTYNGNSFDLPHLNREFVEMGLNPPSPYARIDLYQTVRTRFRFLSGKLEWVVRRLDLGGKMSHEGFGLWRKVMERDPKAQDKMARYCAQDVRITERLYKEIKPWILNHPNEALYAGKSHACPKCGSTKVTKRGLAYTNVSVFQRFQCQDCSAYSRGGVRIGSSSLRPV